MMNPIYGQRYFLSQLAFWSCFISGIALIIFASLQYNRVDLDLWGVMATGALIVENFPRFPYHDIFSYTAPGAPWVYHEWGSGVIFYSLFKSFGSPALFLLSTLLSACTLFFAFKTAEKNLAPQLHGDDFPTRKLAWTITLPVLAYLGFAFFLLLRCQLFSFLGYSLFMFLLQRKAPAKYLLWLLPLLTFIWANIHGGFVMGLFLIGVSAVSALYEKRPADAKFLFTTLFASLAVTLINPYGFAFWQEMIDAWLLPRANVPEWANLLTAQGPLFTGLYVAVLSFWLLCALLTWCRDRSRFPYEFAILAATGLEGFLHFKLTIFALLSLLALTPRIPVREIIPPYANWPNLIFVGINIPVAVCLLFLANTALGQPNALALKLLGAETSQANHVYPIGAINFLKAHYKSGNANLFLPFGWGQYALWALHPHVKVSADGRYETLYPEQVFQDNIAFYAPPYAVEKLAAYPQSNILMIPKMEPGLLPKLAQTPDFKNWRVIYEDAVVTLFAKTPAPQNSAPALPNKTVTLDSQRGDLTRFRLR